jgi:selenocysteine-specific elongation factor
LTEPGTLRPSQVITAKLTLLADAKSLKDQTRIRFHHLASELLGSVRFVDETEELRPGQDAYVQIRLESPVVAVAGDRFVIRRYSPALTIGGGVILDAHLPKLSRKTRVDHCETLERGSLSQRLELMARLEGLRGITLQELQTRTGIRTASLPRKFDNLVAVSGERWVHPDVLTDFRRRSMEFLRDYFERNKMAINVPKGEFVQKLMPRVDANVADFLLRDLAKEKIATIEGDALDIPGRSKKLGGAEGELARMIELRFQEAGLAPPPVSELIKTIHQKPKVIDGVIAFLVKRGSIVRLADGLYIHPTALDAARARMATRKGDTIDVGQFKEFFGLSRKVAIPLLEYFDANGVTKRVGDSRQVL